jgi:hypothetical protein
MAQDGGASLYPEVQLYDPSGINVSDNWGYTEAWIKNCKLSVSGSYTIRTMGFSGVSTTGGYKMDLALKPPAGVIVYGQSVNGQIGFVRDYQDYKFTAQSGDIITIHMAQDGGASLYSEVQLYDPSGTNVSDNWGYTEAWIKSYSIRFSGSYTIRAMGFSGVSTTGAYKLSLNKN